MIYYVEDDDNIRELVVYTLAQMNLPCRGFADGPSFRAAMAEEVPALILLDVMLPGEDGLSLLRFLREDRQTAEIPVIMLTAKGTEMDKVQGLDYGADDYIVKPFSTAELLMRVRAILRRSGAVSAPEMRKNQIAIGDLLLDLDSQSVLKGSETISLTYTEFQILSLLAQNRKKIFSLDHIYQSIWNDNAVGNDAIMVHIKNIRKKLGDSSRNPLYIKTAWGKGYYID